MCPCRRRGGGVWTEDSVVSPQWGGYWFARGGGGAGLLRGRGRMKGPHLRGVAMAEEGGIDLKGLG